MAGDGGHWIRRNCLILARNNNTPVDFWLSLPLTELRGWIDDNDALMER
ncbi:MAG: hypothetical protein FWE80_01545 [Oscillospiraceae bacterium]|nr:hypothetical protein [Oscillospiraceae bacterium]